MLGPPPVLPSDLSQKAEAAGLILDDRPPASLKSLKAKRGGGVDLNQPECVEYGGTTMLTGC